MQRREGPACGGEGGWRQHESGAASPAVGAGRAEHHLGTPAHTRWEFYTKSLRVHLARCSSLTQGRMFQPDQPAHRQQSQGRTSFWLVDAMV